MAHKRKGQLTTVPQWWKHLRDWKRVTNKRGRRAEKEWIKEIEHPRISRRLHLTDEEEDSLRHKITGQADNP